MAQLGERQTEDLKVPGSAPGLGMLCDALFKLVARHSAQLYPVRLLHGIALLCFGTYLQEVTVSIDIGRVMSNCKSFRRREVNLGLPRDRRKY